MRLRIINGWPTTVVIAVAIPLICLAPVEGTEAQGVYDLVIRNGRLMGPESGRDDIANVGVRGDKIAVITTRPLRGRRELDATGLVVAPGFIDILSSTKADKTTHIQKISDGLTTTFGMHGGPLKPAEYHQRMQAIGPLINYGGAVGDRVLRMAAGATDPYKPATKEQLEQMKRMAAEAICAGAAGIGFGINYAPGESYDEVFGLFEVAAEHNVSCHLHARYKGDIFPETMSLAVMEVISIAAEPSARAQPAPLHPSSA